MRNLFGIVGINPLTQIKDVSLSHSFHPISSQIGFSMVLENRDRDT